ncbi:MAG: invasion associated locus B family protein [Gammaproteobacteria bacterium]|nr:invasion associated locus B family protein [Gammaproteobacteria bacterium]
MTASPQRLSISLLLLLAAPYVHAITDGQSFQDWRAKCVNASDKDKQSTNCHIFQDLLQKETGKRVLHIAIGHLPGKQPLAVIITLPLGISLPQGTSLRVDEKDSRTVPLQACFANGCQAAFELEAKWEKLLSAGNNAEVIFYNIHNQPISIPVSLKGISAAIKALKGSK